MVLLLEKNFFQSFEKLQLPASNGQDLFAKKAQFKPL